MTKPNEKCEHRWIGICCTELSTVTVLTSMLPLHENLFMLTALLSFSAKVAWFAL